MKLHEVVSDYGPAANVGGNVEITAKSLDLPDEAEALVEIAIKRRTEPKPLTKEQLHFQRMAD